MAEFVDAVYFQIQPISQSLKLSGHIFDLPVEQSLIRVVAGFSVAQESIVKLIRNGNHSGNLCLGLPEEDSPVFQIDILPDKIKDFALPGKGEVDNPDEKLEFRIAH